MNDIFTVTVTEVLPKEKKQKEEKTAQLGQCTVDLLPLVKGTTGSTIVQTTLWVLIDINLNLNVWAAAYI